MNLYLYLYHYLYLLKNRLRTMYLKGLRAIGLATEFNPLDNRSGLNNSIILTTGPDSTMSRKRYLCCRVPKKQKAVIRELRHYFRKRPEAAIPYTVNRD